ncbi:hypothetical protein BIV08_07510 [Pseudomonas sp. AF76]|nr:hypothetical protein BIV08_07510 [Pseudomonas sp. AF76]
MSGHVALHASVCALLLIVVEAAGGKYLRIHRNKGRGELGERLPTAPRGSMWGLRLKSEPDQGSGDDTALNAMQVYCGL